MRFLLPLALALASCTPAATVWLHPNASLDRAHVLETRCEAMATEAYPVRTVQTAPAVAVRLGGRFCDGPVCLGAGVPLYGSAARHDANAAARSGYFEGCMAQAGFTNARVPQCTAGQGIAPIPAPRTEAAAGGTCLRNGRFYRIISGG